MLSFRSFFSSAIILIIIGGSISINHFYQNTSTQKNLKVEQKKSKLQRIDDIMQEEFEKTKDLSLNEVPRERLLEAKKILQQKINQGNKAAIPNLNWEERGPNNVGGRTRALLIDANDNTGATVWAGGVSGGLWKSTNFFAEDPEWQQVDDFFDNMAITCIVQNPQNPNHIYFGTGEGWFNIDAVRGLGIWESLDGGDTWNQMPSTNNSTFHYVQDLLIDNNQNLYAATRGEGVQRLPMNGNTWTKVLTLTNESTGDPISTRVSDLELSKDGDVYASIGIFSTGSVWKSPAGATVGDEGTWTDITPTALAHRRIEMALAPNDNNRVYLLAQSDVNSNVSAIYRSVDGGNNWDSFEPPLIHDTNPFEQLTPFTRNQAWYDLTAAVDPNDANIIYIGGIDALRSTDGGENWEQITAWAILSDDFPYQAEQNVHADQHQIVFLPGSSSNAIWGTDGGLYYTEDVNNTNSLPSFKNKNLGYNVTQFYSTAMHPSSGTDYYLAGAQDNGTQLFSSQGINSTVRATGGDGGFCHIDQDDPNYQFTSFTGNNLNRSTNGGVFFNRLLRGNGGFFINPSDYDNDTYNFYSVYGNGQLLRWANARTSSDFAVIDLEDLPFFISAITCDPNVPNRLWVAGGGRIAYVDDAHTSQPITNVLTSPNGVAYISSIAVDNTDTNHLLVSISNYGQISIWEVKDATTENPIWTNIDNGLPDFPVRWAMFNPINKDQALIATEMGVWTTDDLNGENTEWGASNSGLANVRVDMLDYRTSDNQIVAATHGRGLFTVDLFNIPQISFVERVSEVNELGAGATGTCSEGFRDLIIPVRMSEPPSSDINVSVIVEVSGTSSEDNKDFDLTNSITNINFTAGTNTLTQDIVLRLLDDALLENKETITMSLSIDTPNSGFVKGSIDTHTIFIEDNEVLPTGPGGDLVTIYMEDFANGFNNVTVTDNNGGGNWAYDFDGPNQVATLQITSPTASNGFAIFDSDGFGDDDMSEDATLSLPPINCSNFFEVQLEFYQQHCRFLEQTIVQVSNDGINFTDYTINQVFGQFHCSSTTQLQVLDIQELADGQPTVYINFVYQGSYDFWWQIDDIEIKGKQIIQPATIASTMRTTRIDGNEVAYFYDSNDKIIASVEQTDGNPMGCVTMTIETAGNGQQTASYLPTTNQKYTDKSYSLQADNPTDYLVTFYFTQTELAIWGGDATQLNVLHGTTALATANSSEVGIIDQANISTLTYANGQYISYQVPFSEEAHFALTNSESALPIELLSFRGKQVGTQIQLNWETATENNTDYYLLERSKNGQDFQYLTKTLAVGNSIKNTTYQEFDPQPFAGINYYRLTAFEKNGATSLAKIINVDFEVESRLSIYPNPIDRGLLQFKLTSVTEEQIPLSVINVNGQVVWEGVISTNASMKIPVTNLAKGIYWLKVGGNRNTKSQRFVVQ